MVRDPRFDDMAERFGLTASEQLTCGCHVHVSVETASRAWQSGEPPPDESTAILGLSMWQAGRTGVEGTLLDPVACKPRPVRGVVDELVDHIGPALRDNGDDKLVKQRLAEIWDRGTGASRQRRVLERTGQLRDVVADLAGVTAGQDG